MLLLKYQFALRPTKQTNAVFLLGLFANVIMITKKNTELQFYQYSKVNVYVRILYSCYII